MGSLLVLALLVLVPARAALAVDLPGLLDLALEPLGRAAVAVEQGDRAGAATTAAAAVPLVDAVVAGSEDAAVAAALGTKARAFGRKVAKLRGKAARAAVVLAKPGSADGAAMRALKRAGKAGLKALRMLVSMPLPGVVVLEENARSAGIHQPGQVVRLAAVVRDDAGNACGESPQVAVVNLAAAVAVAPGASDLGGGRFSVTMGQAGGGAFLVVTACGRTAEPGRLLVNAGPRDDPGTPRDWRRTDVMTGRDVGYLPQIALDPGGSPHVVSMNYATPAYEHSTRTVGGWTTETIAPADQTCGGNVGERSDIVVDRTGAVHVSLEVPDQAIRHGVRGGGWSVTDVSTTICPYSGASTDQAYAFVGHNAIAADPVTDGVWIVGWFWDGVGQGYAAAAWRTGGSGFTQIERGTVGGDTYTGRSPAVAVDGTGAAHVAYEGYTGVSTFVIRYARSTGAGFTTETVAPGGGNSGKCTAIAVDSGGVAHVIYYHPSQGYRHAVRNGAGWALETITPDTAPAGQAWVDVAIDASDELHVVYYRTGGSVRYTHGTTGHWSASEAIAFGETPAIAVTAAGQVHVVYRDSLDDRLVHVTR